jgi:hypothetical protein
MTTRFAVAALAVAGSLVVTGCGGAASGDERSRAPAHGSGAGAAIFATNEYRVTSGDSIDYFPSIGRDAIGMLVVYTSRPKLDLSYGPGALYYRRLSERGAPTGEPVLVSGGGTDDQLNDVSGKYIVYTAYDSSTSTHGRVVLYNIENGRAAVLAGATGMREARISGNYVVWAQASAFTSTLQIFDITTLGLGGSATLIAGPTPAAKNPEIGERFVVWEQTTNGQSDVYAYDLATGQKQVVAADPVNGESLPATSGPWVVWEGHTPNVPATRIEAANLDTGERRVIADDGAVSSAPTIDGNVVTWESTAAGSFDVYAYRLDTRETFRVTSDPADQTLNSVFGDTVAYVDQRAGAMDVFVSKLVFEAIDPCADAGGDADGDGVCGSADNCASTANADQVDGDGDGLGDACDACPADAANDADGDGVCGDADNCASVPNAAQADADGDGIGNFCDACPLDAANDADGDFTCGNADNCPVFNLDQADADGDGIGDACDACPADATNDADGDGVCGAPPTCENGGLPADQCGDACGQWTLAPTTAQTTSVTLDRTTEVAIPAVLDVTAGSAGHGWALLRFTRPGGEVRCFYRGGGGPQGERERGRKGKLGHPTAGAEYQLMRCVGGGRPLGAGDAVKASAVALRVLSGAPRGAPVTVAVTVAEVGTGCGGK